GSGAAVNRHQQQRRRRRAARSGHKRAQPRLHLILTILTCGTWLPIWLIIAIVGHRRVQVGGTPAARRLRWSSAPWSAAYS
ncbi:hypothetical protein I552_10243, partial [Mycobacterium xenopi 3993]